MPQPVERRFQVREAEVLAEARVLEALVRVVQLVGNGIVNQTDLPSLRTVGDVLRDVGPVEIRNLGLQAPGAHEVIRLHEGLDDVGHPPDEDVRVEELHEPFVQVVRDGSLVTESPADLIRQGAANAVRPTELFEIHGVHGDRGKETHGQRPGVECVEPEKRP